MTGKKALIVVDLQNDFCPGGALSVSEADKIIIPVNRLVNAFAAIRLPVVFTRDWHPRRHVSFQAQGGRWPPHCVARTWGARFNPSLSMPRGRIVISKATRKEDEAYSGFQGTDLAERLWSAGVEEVYICGLATDYCVKNTALDAIELGFQTYLVTDCIKGVDLGPEDSANAVRSMVARGVEKTTSARILKGMDRRVAVSSSS